MVTKKMKIILITVPIVTLVIIAIIVAVVVSTSGGGGKGSGKNCKHKYLEGGYTAADKDVIVKKHNDLRKMLENGEVPDQPKGKDFKTMKWDETLAKEAQKIADICVFEHVTVKDSRWGVGQNLYTQKGSHLDNKKEWEKGIQSWFDEVKDYTYGPFKPGGKPTGHYTQVVWAETEYVGCGFSYFEMTKVKQKQKLYVCNYGPAGNFLGKHPYEKAE